MQIPVEYGLYTFVKNIHMEGTMSQMFDVGHSLKGTSNCLAEFEKNIETASQIFLNFLHVLRGILPEIDKNLPCSFPFGVSQTW